MLTKSSWYCKNKDGNRILYLRFFFFNILLATTFIFSHKIFDNNFSIPSAVFWVGLMMALPLGAALGTRLKEQSAKILILFLFSFLWLIVSSALYVHLILPSLGSFDPTGGFLFKEIAKHFLAWSSFLGLIALVIFFPLWLVMGLFEMHLYLSLIKRPPPTQWLAYLSSLTGLFVGQGICFFLLPSPQPFWIGIIILLSFIFYSSISYFKWSWPKIILIFLLGICLLAENGYVKNSLMVHKSVNPKSQAHVLYDQWMPHMRLTVVKNNDRLFGYYNGVFHWVSKDSNSSQCFAIDPLISHLLTDDAKVAIIGAGGGSQLNPFLEHQPKHIYAIDIVPHLSTTLSQLGVSSFLDPRVTSVTKDGRKFIAESQEQFDLIFLPFTESIFKLSKSLFEPADHLFTLEAIKDYQAHLKPNGVIIIKKALLFPKLSFVMANYAKTMQKAGLKVGYWTNDCVAILLGAKDDATLTKASQILNSSPLITHKDTPQTGVILRDDKPFFASVMFTPRIVYALGVIGIVSCLLIFFFCFYSQKRILFPAILCGLNYTLILLSMQLLMFFQIDNPLEATMIGSFLFLGIVWIGTLLYKKRMILFIITLLILIAILNKFLPGPLGVLGLLGLWSGGFFPRLIHSYQDQLKKLLICDGLGAALAGVLYFLIPTVGGIKLFLIVVYIIFFITFWQVNRADKIQ